MLDLNVDAAGAGEVDFAFHGGDTDTPTAANSVGSTTTSAAADELDCDTSLLTLNFSILGKDVIHIDDDDNNEENGDDNVIGELLLFPVGPSVTDQYRLNLSATPEFSTGRGVELGIINTRLPMSSNQVTQPQVKKSRRGPRSRSSQYRGVTFYRRTGRWESHIWDCGKQVYLGDLTLLMLLQAIMFRGVDADINFNISDYEEDMKQMKNFTKDEFVHLLRRQSTGFPRGNSKYKGSVSLQKCNQWQLVEKKAYEKSIIQQNEKVAIPIAWELNFGRRDVGSDSNLDLNLGISMSSDSSQGNGFAAPKPLLFSSSGNQNLQVEAKYHSATWGGIFPGFPTNNKDKVLAAKTSCEAAGTQIWPWKMQSQGMVPLQAVSILPSAASSGFAHTVSPCLNSLISCNQRPQFPSFQRLP